MPSTTRHAGPHDDCDDPDLHEHEVDINAVLAQKYEERLATTAALLLDAAQDVVPEQVTQVATFFIPPTLVPSPRYTDQRVVVTTLRVSVTRMPDGPGDIEVMMHARRAKADGTPDARSAADWMEAPQQVAGPLLLAAMTRGGVNHDRAAEDH